MLLWPFNKYPGTDYETFNWEWILKTVKDYTKKVDDFIEYITNTWNDFRDDITDTWNDFRDDITDTWNDFKDWTTGEIDQMHDDFAEYVNVTEGALNTGAIANGAITRPKMDSTLLGETENVYITPEEYGAVGDGVTNDSAAFVAAFNACKTGTKYLKTYHKNYNTDGLVLDYAGYRFPMEIEGNITDLEIKGQSDASTVTEVYIEGADELTLTNVQGIRLDISKCGKLTLKGDTASTSGNGGCAYNVVNGVKIDRVDLVANNQGWVNENIVNRARITELNVHGSTVHMADSNRFYDVILENGIIDLDYAQSTYVRYRGEGAPTVTNTHGYNNTCVRTWISSRLGYNVFYDHDNLTAYYEMSLPFKPYKLFHMDWLNGGGDSDTHLVSVAPNTSYYTFRMKMDSDMVLKMSSDMPAVNINVRLYDAQGNNITTSNDSGASLNSKFNCPQIAYAGGSDGYYRGASLRNEYTVKAFKQETETWMQVTMYTLGSTVHFHCIDTTIFSSDVPNYYEMVNIIA